MHELLNKFKETVNLAKLIDNSPVYVNVLASTHSFRISDNIGDKGSFHSTAVGKTIIAFLPEKRRKEILENYSFVHFTKKTIMTISELEKELTKIQTQGYAMDNEEGHEGVVCVGVPIFNKDMVPIAAISISMPKVRASKTTLEKIKKELMNASKIISVDLKNQNI